MENNVYQLTTVHFPFDPVVSLYVLACVCLEMFEKELLKADFLSNTML